MSNEHRALGSALRKISSLLLRLSEQELQKLSDPSYEIEIKFIRKKNKDEAIENQAIDLKSITEKLINAPSREVASDILQTYYKSKKTLEQIARDLDIPILKQDKSDNLRDKIVEATAGARLRSEAIKGTD